MKITLAAHVFNSAHAPLLAALALVRPPERWNHYFVRALEEFWKLTGRIGVPWTLRVAVGHVVHRLICRYQERAATGYTRFFRNRPQLDALAHLQFKGKHDALLRVAILACSKGPEAYSVAWTLRSAHPETRVQVVGLDISESAVLAAQEGVYASDAREVEDVSPEMLEVMFDRRDGAFVVKESLRKDIKFFVGDACNPRLRDLFGPQDLVTANNFLVHLPDAVAEACLRNIEELVVPGGVIVIWGVNLNVKVRVIKALRLEPLHVNLEEIHNADRAALNAWPLTWWGLEPLDKARPDWTSRYCTIFRKPEKAPSLRS